LPRPFRRLHQHNYKPDSNANRGSAAIRSMSRIWTRFGVRVPSYRRCRYSGVDMLRTGFALLAAAVWLSVLVAVPSAGSAAPTPDSYGLVDPSTGIWHLYENGAEATSGLSARIELSRPSWPRLLSEAPTAQLPRRDCLNSSASTTSLAPSPSTSVAGSKPR
jgi:hypothetical protein